MIGPGSRARAACSARLIVVFSALFALTTRCARATDATDVQNATIVRCLQHGTAHALPSTDWHLVGAHRSRRARCLARGDGSWVPRPESDEHYTSMSPLYVGQNPRAAKYWSKCDERARAGQSAYAANAKARIGFMWQPAGEDCAGLGGPSASLLFPELKRAFCARFAGKKLLFVGDSTQGQHFTSFVHSVGVTSSWWSRPTPCYHGWKIPLRSETDAFDVTVQLCGGAVEARNIRNEHLLLNASEQELWRQRNAMRGHGLRVRNKFCRFPVEAVQWADVVVLNRGLHFTPLDRFASELDATMRMLATLRAANGGRPELILRSTHAPVPDCSIKRPISAVPLEHTLDQGPRKYHWGDMAATNAVAACLALEYGASFINVFRLSSHRPDVPFVPGDCVHSCLPGPVDEWARMLLALLVRADDS